MSENATHRKTLNINDNKIYWDEFPKGIIGWILWSLPHNTWRYLIWIIGVFIAMTAILAFYQLWSIRSFQIEQFRTNIFIDQWARSDNPEWKSALLNNWSEPSDITDEIWREATEHSSSLVRKAVATHPYANTFYLDKLSRDPKIEIRLSAIFNQSEWSVIFGRTCT